MKLFNLKQGQSPLLISMPHCGTYLPNYISNNLTSKAKTLPDTDWFIPQLYNFIYTEDISVISSNFSRYCVDLNRPPSGKSLYPGQPTTSICPEKLFNGEEVYINNQGLTKNEIDNRRKFYWEPYHNQIKKEINRLKDRNGYCIVYDAHSIASRVPNLFSGQLPDLNFGTNKGKSCAATCAEKIQNILNESAYSFAINGRFIGGYITRQYGNPKKNIHAMQMEISQKNYMEEAKNYCFREDKAINLRPLLSNIIETLLCWSPSN